MSRARAARSPFAAVKKFVADLLLWSFFAAGLGMSAGGAGALFDGTAKTVATVAGGVVSLIAGSRIAKKPKIKAFLGRPGTLWFLFLFNGGTAAAMYFTMDGAKGIIGAACMGLVSLGALGGLVSGRRARREAAQAAAAAPQAPVSQGPWA
ncbi:hypothetical protein [Streptomyces cylindrosporus]|uniref:Integral membrane protein n=1 Tax=Streptomyces cylindrosporus TaxID=2927583 RepID=A0ABS9Y5H2_9ACTN|nr:hypothetical protein [Streptomyces cylindrosporus]MCI3272472.1 hypothetical protein [Streptomyces cylindrosporus]